MRCTSVLAIAFSLVSSQVCVAQAASNANIFTLSVTPPTKARDVQVRYMFTADLEIHEYSVAKPTEDNKILIQTAIKDHAAKGLKLIAYAPGCQFVTISVDDLAGSNRQGAFECTHLNTIPFFGHANVSSLSDKALDVEALYACDWASQFFGKQIAISPISLGRAEIASDGSFVIDLPDFSADPLWSSLSNNATLMFSAIDAKNGQPLVTLKAAAQSAGGGVKVAAGYPEVEFSIQTQVSSTAN